ncbi:hypothetical protein [Paraflavitalea speifideaquila]|uniref:hypothetical protein n=1 Tax=Paraflavitalea speifideaquila TaxID=3076558 RepID=UPI0028EA4A9B|nr:hypothetical protein [Paraflavitalea speifideiaquila]
MISETRFRIKLYELPFLLVLAVIVMVSAWRCFYYPPSPRDLTSGAEVIAEYTVKEKTMVNSVFTVNLETTNNQFKPPFITSLQVIYKYAGFPFGQIWLSTLFICFLIFLYHALCLKIHRILAGMLMLIFLAIPEMYAYTFMALFDYSNAVFFFLGTYFMITYFKSNKRNDLAMAGLLMGFATYIRSETLILVGILTLAILWRHIKKWESLASLLSTGLYFLLPAVIFYVLSITVHVNYYLPQKYDVEGLVNQHLLDLTPIWERLKAMNKELIFSEHGIQLYAYSFFIFLLVLLCDLIFSVKLNPGSRNWLFAVLVIYCGLPVLGYLLPLLDIANSTKRGLFKIFPLMIMYMGSSSLLIRVTQKNKRLGNEIGIIDL